jgi:hypothetical protein
MKGDRDGHRPDGLDAPPKLVKQKVKKCRSTVKMSKSEKRTEK